MERRNGRQQGKVEQEVWGWGLEGILDIKQKAVYKPSSEEEYGMMEELKESHDVLESSQQEEWSEMRPEG